MMDTDSINQKPSAVTRLALKWLLAVFVGCGLGSVAFSAPRPADTLRFGTPKNYTWGELSLMPEYCYDVQGELYGGPNYSTGMSDSPRSARWVALMGMDFWHMHHYCYVLADLIRLGAAGIRPQSRNAIYANMDRNLQYVLQNCKPTNPLYPEFLLRAGDLYLLQGRTNEASQAFAKARDIKPDYWPAYTRWIEFLMSLKLRDQAKTLAEEGLQHAPDAIPLRELYAKLGGSVDRLHSAGSPTIGGAATSAAPVQPIPAQTVTPLAEPKK
jgi:tetratricopeptide (TPR) repeat protein